MLEEKIVILGNGPAGCTAAIYAARAGLKPRVFAGEIPGGLLTQTTEIENFPGFPDGIAGFDLVMAIQSQAEKFGAEIDFDVVQKVVPAPTPGGLHELHTGDGRTILTRALIIATGAAPRYLGVPGEERLRGHGVSACATCDGAFYKDVPVVVAGGGDSAMEEALFLTRFASRVHLIHRRDQLRASAIMAERAKQNPKIEFHLSCVIEAIEGKDEVESVQVRNLSDNSVMHLPCKAFFAALGHLPSTAVFKEAGVETDKGGFIVLKDGSATSVSGIFAAGDCADPRYRQAIIAAGAGAKAAMDAEKYLQNGR